MKTKVFLLFALIALLAVFNACEEKEDDAGHDPADTILLPPKASMLLDSSVFESSKSALIELSNTEQNSSWNAFVAKTAVDVWNLVLFTTLVVPVTSFEYAFLHEPEYIGNATWQWSYEFNTWAGKYVADLTGQVTNENVCGNEDK
ncbi:MAG: hypothetical protein HC896_13325 [Bacteroidales bacterium]|nr:hypothetical protein [Bacteroidales bacterium]